MNRFTALLAISVSARALTLDEALAKAGDAHPSVALARLRTLESKLGARSMESGYRPQVNLSIASAYQTNNLQGLGLAFPGLSSRLGPYRTFDARPVAAQTVLDLALLSRIRAVRAEAEASRHDEDATRETVMLAAAELYIAALEADSRVQAADGRIGTARAVVEQVRQRMEAGAASKLDVERAVERLEAENLVRAAAARDAGSMRALLAEAMGVETAVTDLAPVSSGAVTAAEDEALRGALANRVELRSLDARAKSAAFDAEAARRARLPKIGAVAGYGLLGAGPDRAIGTYAVGASMTMPLWTSGRIESEIAAAVVRQRMVDEQRRATRLRITREVRQALVEAAAARESVQAAERGTSAAREALELSRLRLGSGLATALDVVVAQGELAQADDSRVRAGYQLLLAQVRLSRAMGDTRQAASQFRNH